MLQKAYQSTRCSFTHAWILPALPRLCPLRFCVKLQPCGRASPASLAISRIGARHGPPLQQGVAADAWVQRDADPHVGPGRSRQDHYPVQTEAVGSCDDHPYSRAPLLFRPSLGLVHLVADVGCRFDLESCAFVLRACSTLRAAKVQRRDRRALGKHWQACVSTWLRAVCVVGSFGAPLSLCRCMACGSVARRYRNINFTVWDAAGFDRCWKDCDYL